MTENFPKYDKFYKPADEWISTKPKTGSMRETMEKSRNTQLA